MNGTDELSGPIYFDTNVIIAIVEGATPLSGGQSELLESIDARRVQAVTSELTIAECLVKPFAERDANAVEMFLSFLDGRPSLPTIPIDRTLLLEAARLRADTKLKLADAIHVATAVQARCSAFMTDDRRVKPIGEMGVVSWSSLGTGQDASI
ncbi:type II toxin-antitoxin system VapC family toxin [Arvimicrobium flavum]|uniref:type II toxin-antitoxin system VapC family toxin n=1 Tax=Arvimicrobium flavum TaxID=3393320 RepID=UPI00237A7B28|nr:type II toxin-antitoxin system VapC family toxin [Mesorhizobium shangrilense]